ncbi:MULTISPECIES: glycoside hydrolase family 76 protein [unclassified Microbacterium]|uniref:glycoside hydrolase family 76 protein n=1 Tax=unclassified Microbacterium TaxID=2609290 RepID=UPI001600E1FF|nr:MULTISPECIES: glycoside hydrolase family 76 protein [unclassified Microbacterium]MBT2484247.1 glycoside hydrolase [Microbacterium sp. ISL-108]
MTSTPAQTWSARADTAQHSLDHFFRVGGPQYLANSHPHDRGNTEVFNYWWLAHVIDARTDAWDRSGDPAWRQLAIVARDNIVERNGGQLFNDYFDDMLWFALALERVHQATGEQQYLDEAIAIWDHVIAEGWNDTLGWSLAWRKQQLAYKNTPANGPLVILGVRLSRHDSSRDYLGYAQLAFEWLTANLVSENGFVEDGVNRNEDGAVDTQWRFTYNQGLYIGAAVELFTATDARHYLDRAVQTAMTAVRELSDGTVFPDEGDGGDEGLFKGVFYRYLGELLAVLARLAEDGDDEFTEQRVELERFLRAGTDALWENGVVGGHLRPGNDWSKEPVEWIPYSTMVSAIFAVEQRARLEAREAGAESSATASSAAPAGAVAG